MKIINGIPAGTIVNIGVNDESLINVRKRLQLLYPGRHELKITSEHELLMVYLNLNLEEASQEELTPEIAKPVLNYA